MTRKSLVHVVFAHPESAASVYLHNSTCLNDLRDLVSMLRPGTLISAFADEENRHGWTCRLSTEASK